MATAPAVSAGREAAVKSFVKFFLTALLLGPPTTAFAATASAATAAPTAAATWVPLKWESARTRSKVDRKAAEADSVVRKGPFHDDWDSLRGYQAPEWFRDAKFGIFIHWGVYSVPAYDNEWYSRNMYQQGSPAFKHHVKTYGPQARFGYKDFIPMFKAKKFDPLRWARLFKEAGARYVVPVAEHHDGFAMYDSDFSRWTAAGMGPRRDVIGELAKAVRKEGLVFGLSSHRAEHWWFMNGGRKFPSDVQDPRFADFYGPAMPQDTPPSAAYMRNWLARSCELVDKYRPRLVYFDWWIGEQPVFMPYLREFTAYYYDRARQWKEGVVLTTKDKTFVPGTAVEDVEKGKLPGIHPVPWQTDTSVSWKSWAYLKHDSLKDPESLIQDLIDTVSRNGNFLLDIGPKPDGAIPKAQEAVLLAIGRWLKVNGEAIYGTRPWVAFGEGPTKEAMGKFSETKVPYAPGDLRFTRKGDALYIISLVPPEGPLTVRTLGRDAAPDLSVREVSILGSRRKVDWKRSGDFLTLPPPAHAAKGPVVYKALLDGSSAGRLHVETSAQGLAAGAVLQNYGAHAVVKDVSLEVDGKQEAAAAVTVEARSSSDIRLSHETGRAGLYRVVLEVPGQPVLSGRAALPRLELIGKWLFHPGDDASWSGADLGDGGWERVVLPSKWEDYGDKCEDCYGWYRLHLSVPAAWKGHDLSLPLGKIDDADITYFNGVEIGRSGGFPPNFATAWDRDRFYEVAERLVRFGGDNVIAIRIYNGSGSAGLYDGPLGPVGVGKP